MVNGIIKKMAPPKKEDVSSTTFTNICQALIKPV